MRSRSLIPHGLIPTPSGIVVAFAEGTLWREDGSVRTSSIAGAKLVLFDPDIGWIVNSYNYLAISAP